MTAPPQLNAALAGCTIVIAADRRSAELAGALERRGARVCRAPALSIVPNADDEELLRRTRELIADPPDIVVVSTGVGFRGWMDAAHEHDLSEQLTRALSAARFIARGPKARGAIQQAGFTAEWVAESELSAEVAAHLLSSSVAGARVAVQHHGSGSDGLDEQLAAHGAEVVNLTVYRWGPAPDPQLVRRTAAQAAYGGADAVLFTSAPGADAWIRAAKRAGAVPGMRARSQSGRLLIGAVGPITARPLDEAGLVTTIADRGRLGSLARCVIRHFDETGAAPSLRTTGGTLSMRSGGAVLDGRFIPLSGTGVKVLGALFDARGRVLSREELARTLPRAGHKSHAAEMAVARIREALGGAEVVSTVVKRGYRLAVEVV